MRVGPPLDIVNAMQEASTSLSPTTALFSLFVIAGLRRLELHRAQNVLAS
jgi:hypothetical protein